MKLFVVPNDSARVDAATIAGIFSEAADMRTAVDRLCELSAEAHLTGFNVWAYSDEGNWRSKRVHSRGRTDWQPHSRPNVAASLLDQYCIPVEVVPFPYGTRAVK